MYIHRSYDYVERPEINIMTEHIECIFVEVKSQFKKHKKKILVGAVYRPPNINAFAEQIIKIIHTKNWK